eukprot:gene11501-biopygen7862
MRLCGRPAAPCWRAQNHLTHMAPMRLRGRRGRARGACVPPPQCSGRVLPAAPCWRTHNHLTIWLRCGCVGAPPRRAGASKTIWDKRLMTRPFFSNSVAWDASGARPRPFLPDHSFNAAVWAPRRALLAPAAVQVAAAPRRAVLAHPNQQHPYPLAVCHVLVLSAVPPKPLIRTLLILGPVDTGTRNKP